MFGLVIAVAVLAVLLAAVVVAGRAGPSEGFERIARCRAGHLFDSTVIPMASFKAIRLGRRRFQRCPVGNHWTLVSWVDPASLTPRELAEARSIHDTRVP
jgi:hypothetical protein